MSTIVAEKDVSNLDSLDDAGVFDEGDHGLVGGVDGKHVVSLVSH
jgi:hypothetical protein